MPRGVVKLEKRTLAVKPGVEVTGDLNGTPEGWKVVVEKTEETSSRRQNMKQDIYVD